MELRGIGPHIPPFQHCLGRFSSGKGLRMTTNDYKEGNGKGPEYLDGCTWSQITREERFFCLKLYEYIEKKKPGKFLEALIASAPESKFRWINGKSKLANPNQNWDVGYEVCFYRDMGFKKNDGEKIYSPKRTFDLCFFGEDNIIILEAKAQQSFDTDQLKHFGRDKEAMLESLNLNLKWSQDQILLFGLISSHYSPSPSTQKYFDALFTWEDIAKMDGSPLRRKIFRRADKIYPHKSE